MKREWGFSLQTGFSPYSTAHPAGLPDLSIAIDIDGVLTEHPRPLAKAAAAHFGIDLPESAFIDSAGLNVPVQIRDWVYRPGGPAANLRSHPSGPAFMTRVLELFGPDRVMIITARPAQSAEMTLGWLREHGFPDCEMIFADEKATIAISSGCTFAVEDSERHALSYAAAGVTCFLIGQEGNGHGATPGIERFKDLDGVLRTLEAIVGSHKLGLPVNGARELPIVPRRPKMVVSDAIHPTAREALSIHGEIVDVVGTDEPALLAVLHDADALIVRSETQVTASVIDAAPKLRVIARAGVGVDNIDLDAATRAGVLVLNAPGANATSAGEHTIALLLAVTRQLPYANESTHAGLWQRKTIKPIDLRGRTVGIVGLGRVGAVVAKRLLAFEMNVIAYDPYIATERFVELGVTPVELDALWETADIITFHLPATNGTHHMLNATTIQRLKPGTIVLNCARGEVVDEQALADALRSGRVAGAGVDVFPHEPCHESPLFGLPNVVLTPHTGGSSAEALSAVGEMISTTTIAALNGQAVPNAVNLPPASLLAPELQRLTNVAGAAGHLLAVLQPDTPETIRVTTRGLVAADIVEHVLAAALSEALIRWTNRRVTPVNARLIAEDAGIAIKTITATPDPAVEPSFAFEASGDPVRHVKVAWDRTTAGIVEIDRFTLERALAGEVIITHHRDQPGVVGRLGTILGRHEVNIAGMQVGRHHRGGEAIMVLNVDDEISDAALDEIRVIPGVKTAFKVSLPPAESRAPRPRLVAVGG
ncbi:MAG: phosphoglycerate dehydrogenase [Thermomicrobiales bacterium]